LLELWAIGVSGAEPDLNPFIRPLVKAGFLFGREFIYSFHKQP
jgi:hypothetical protein